MSAPAAGRGAKLPALYKPTARERLDHVADRLRHFTAARLAVGAFVILIFLVTGLLSLPVATASGHPASFINSLFTATSAICVTGLTVVPTAAFWSPFGQAVILVAIKVGGMGVMTIGALLSLLVSRRLGITQKLLTASETRTSQLGDVRAIVGAVVITSTSCEAVLAVLLTARFAALGGGFGEALWHGVFYGVSTFNNAGFDVTASGLSMHVADWMVLLPIALGVIVGSVGFPVILNIKRNLRRPSHWTLTTKLTLTASAVLLVVAPVLIGLFEWNNPGTFGSMSVGEKILNLFFAGVQTRSGGFATVNVARMHPATLLVQDALMFVGGGSASTAGGIKVTTLAVMVVAVRAEARGDRDAEAFGRRLSPSVLRVAVTVVGVSILIVLAASLVLFAVSSAPTDQILFEVFSAFGTCGLSTGLTAHLPMVGKAAITLLMLVGRLGTMTIAATLAMSNRRRIIRLPEERPIVG